MERIPIVHSKEADTAFNEFYLSLYSWRQMCIRDRMTGEENLSFECSFTVSKGGEMCIRDRECAMVEIDVITALYLYCSFGSA